MLRNAILSATLALGLAGAAAAAESPIKVLGTGENFAVQYSNDGGNILGGGPVTVVKFGQDAQYLHAPDAPAQRDWIANFAGQGENGRIVYSPAPGMEAYADLKPAG